MRLLTLVAVCTILVASICARAVAQDSAAPVTGTHGLRSNQIPTEVSAMSDSSAMSADRKHVLCWLEIKCTDFAAMKAFYGSVFGWKFQPFMDGYEIYTTPAGLMGGFSSMGLEQWDKPTAIPFIYVPDVEAALQSVDAAGGKRMFGPEAVGEDGKIGIFADPSGTIYGFADMWMPVTYSPDPLGKNGGDQPVGGSICAIEMYGGDFTATRPFFVGQFGWNLSADPAMPEYMSFNPGTGTTGVFQSHTPQAPSMVYIWSDNLEATIEAVKANGGTLIDVFEAPGMPRFAYFTDPNGNTMGLMGK